MLLYCDGITSMSDEQFKAFFERMPISRQKKAMRYVRVEDRKLCVAAFALLDYALGLGGYRIGEYRFCEGETGKPYLENFPLEFSLSHTSDAVACVVSKCEIGVDVQKKISRYEDVMKRVCCENEIRFVSDSDNPSVDFTKIWTLKESYVKCKGTGISDNLSKYDFSDVAKNGGGKLNDYEFSMLDVGDCVLSVCSLEPIDEIKKVSLWDLYASALKSDNQSVK